MDFTAEQYTALVDEARAGLARYRAILDDLAVAGRFLPPPLRIAARELVREAVALGRELAELVGELLAGCLAPVLLFRRAWHWRDIHGTATGVAAALTDQNLVVDDSAWTGPARGAYETVVGAQSKAAAQLGVIADGVAVNLAECAGAGVAFTVTLAVIVAKLLAAATTALAAFGTGVFCLAGVALIVEEAGLDSTAVGAALAALGVCLTAQARNMVALHGLAVDRTSFPGGAWPAAHTAGYSDATVTDGDADWSLRR